MSLPSILKLTPYLREVVWGGRRLESEFGKKLPPGKRVGEAHELSAIAHTECHVAEGPLTGKSLPDLIQTYGSELIGQGVVDRYSTHFPLLIKWLDAREDLSIQVHPDDDYATKQNLGRFGKSEAWYVVKSEDGRIAGGLRDGVDADSLRQAIDAGRVEDAVIYHSVKPGDVVSIPPGTVHALCGGVMVYELQQSSDITFRLYDYDRPGPDGQPRELHVDQGLAVTRPDIDASPKRVSGPRQVTTGHFTLDRYASAARNHEPIPSFSAITFVQGAANLSADGTTCRATSGDTLLIPAERGISVQPDADCEYLIAAVPA